MNILVAFCACALYFATSNPPILTGGTPALRKSAGWMTVVSVTLVTLDLFPAVFGYLGYSREHVFKVRWGDLITIATYGGFTYFLGAIWRIHGEKRQSSELKPRGTRSDNARLVSYQTRLRGEMVALGERKRLAAEREGKDSKNAKRKIKRKEQANIMQTSEGDCFLPQRESWPVDLLRAASVEQQMVKEVRIYPDIRLAGGGMY